jgi:23S rRNA pseudouridine1911/1915/1917 synthase
MSAHVLEVREEDDGTRLDVVLVRRLEGLGRAGAKRLIDEGKVEVDGRRRTKAYRVSAGDRITVAELPPPTDFYCAPDPDLPLVVRFEDERYVIVDKAAGTPSHPLREGELGTLAGALVARYPEMRDVGYRKREPGILHRLDTGTSGLMLAARTEEAFNSLREMLRGGQIEKRYLARCVGDVVAPQAIDAPIANDPHNERRVRVCTDPREIKRLRAVPATTEVLTSTPAPLGSLVEVRANHARRHQVRAHLASIGHPLLGDPLYGGPDLPNTPHHLLHASALRIDSTWTTSPWGQAPPPETA